MPKETKWYDYVAMIKSFKDEITTFTASALGNDIESGTRNALADVCDLMRDNRQVKSMRIIAIREQPQG